MIPSPFDLLPESAVRLLEVRQGDYLFRYGDQTRGLFVSLDTNVHLNRVGQDGQTIMIHRAVPGSWFAEASLFSEIYHCDAVAQQGGNVIRIDKTAVLLGLRDNEFACSYCQVLSVQIQNMRLIREIVAIRSAKNRVFAGLEAGLHVGSIVEFASVVSLTHEATYRALRQLVIDGLVQNPRRGIYRLRSL